MERREFIKTVGATAGASTVGAGAASGRVATGDGAVDPRRVSDADVTELSTADAQSSGVEILTDDYSVSHVYADDLYSLAYGQGYVQARDRFFQMDLLRLIGRGESAKSVGPGQVQSDISVKRDLYTDAELDEQWQAADPEWKEMLRGFTAGINASVEEMESSGDMPGEFDLLGRDPGPWKPTDSIAVMAYAIGFFGVSGGKELSNAKELAEMFNRFDTEKEAWEAYHDLNKVRVPDTHYGSLQEHEVDGTHERALAYEEVPEEQLRAIRAAADVEAWGLEDLDVFDQIEEFFRDTFGFFQGEGFGSNAVIVGGEHTSTGKPMLGGGPQMSLLKPPVLHEVGLHGAGYDVAGAAIVGTPSVVIGRTPDFAFTATTAGDDMVDTIAIELDPNDRYRYKWEGDWYHIRTETYRHEPNTWAGIVEGEFDLGEYDQEVAWIEQAGQRMPVVAYNEEENLAYVQRTATWMEEAQGGYQWAQVGRADDLDEVAEALSGFPFGFNFHYVDREDIAYFRCGKVPYRTDDGDPRFPMLDSHHEWDGWVSGTGFGTGGGASDVDTREEEEATVASVASSDTPPTGDHTGLDTPRPPSASGYFSNHDNDGGYIIAGKVNPERGYVVNWNNAPAPGWLCSDTKLKWQSTHRVEVMERLVREAIDETGGNLTLNDVEGIVEDCGVEHPYAPAIVPYFVEAARDSGDQQLEAMADELEAWAATEYSFRPGNGGRYPNGGMAIWETVRHELQDRMFADTMGHTMPDLEFDPTAGDGMSGEVDPHAADHGPVNTSSSVLLDTLEGRSNFQWLGDYSNEIALTNAHSGLAMQATDGWLWGTDVQQATANLTDDQLWYARNAETGSLAVEDGEAYVLHAANRDQVAALDDPTDDDASLELGDPPDAEDDDTFLQDVVDAIADFFSGWFGDDEEPPEGSGKVFEFHANGDGTYRIQNIFSEKVLQPEPGDTGEDGASIVQADWDGSQAQRWQVQQLDGGVAAQDLLVEAMKAAGTQLTARYGSADPGDWRLDNRQSSFVAMGAAETNKIAMSNRASYQQAIAMQEGHAVAGSVLPPSNTGHMGTWEVLGTQIGSEPDRLTQQLDIYAAFEYKPHPVTRERVENQTSDSRYLEP